MRSPRLFSVHIISVYLQYNYLVYRHLPHIIQVQKIHKTIEISDYAYRQLVFKVHSLRIKPDKTVLSSLLLAFKSREYRFHWYLIIILEKMAQIKNHYLKFVFFLFCLSQVPTFIYVLNSNRKNKFVKIIVSPLQRIIFETGTWSIKLESKIDIKSGKSFQ